MNASSVSEKPLPQLLQQKQQQVVDMLPAQQQNPTSYLLERVREELTNQLPRQLQTQEELQPEDVSIIPEEKDAADPVVNHANSANGKNNPVSLDAVNQVLESLRCVLLAENRPLLLRGRPPSPFEWQFEHRRHFLPGEGESDPMDDRNWEDSCVGEEKQDFSHYYRREEPFVTTIYPPPAVSSNNNRAKIYRHKMNSLVELFRDETQVKRVWGINIIDHLSSDFPRLKHKHYLQLPSVCRLDEVGPWAPHYLSKQTLQQCEKSLDYIIQQKAGKLPTQRIEGLFHGRFSSFTKPPTIVHFHSTPTQTRPTRSQSAEHLSRSYDHGYDPRYDPGYADPWRHRHSGKYIPYPPYNRQNRHHSMEGQSYQAPIVLTTQPENHTDPRYVRHPHNDFPTTNDNYNYNYSDKNTTKSMVQPTPPTAQRPQAPDLHPEPSVEKVRTPMEPLKIHSPSSSYQTKHHNDNSEQYLQALKTVILRSSSKSSRTGRDPPGMGAREIFIGQDEENKEAEVSVEGNHRSQQGHVSQKLFTDAKSAKDGILQAMAAKENDKVKNNNDDIDDASDIDEISATVSYSSGHGNDMESSYAQVSPKEALLPVPSDNSSSSSSLSVVDEDKTAVTKDMTNAKKPPTTATKGDGSGLPHKAPVTTPRTSTTGWSVDSYSDFGEIGSCTGLVIENTEMSHHSFLDERKLSPVAAAMSSTMRAQHHQQHKPQTTEYALPTASKGNTISPSEAAEMSSSEKPPGDEKDILPCGSPMGSRSTHASLKDQPHLEPVPDVQEQVQLKPAGFAIPEQRSMDNSDGKGLLKVMAAPTAKANNVVKGDFSIDSGSAAGNGSQNISILNEEDDNNQGTRHESFIDIEKLGDDKPITLPKFTTAKTSYKDAEMKKAHETNLLHTMASSSTKPVKASKGQGRSADELSIDSGSVSTAAFDGKLSPDALQMDATDEGLLRARAATASKAEPTSDDFSINFKSDGAAESCSSPNMCGSHDSARASSSEEGDDKSVPQSAKPKLASLEHRDMEAQRLHDSTGVKKMVSSAQMSRNQREQLPPDDLNIDSGSLGGPSTDGNIAESSHSKDGQGPKVLPIATSLLKGSRSSDGYRQPDSDEGILQAMAAQTFTLQTNQGLDDMDIDDSSDLGDISVTSGNSQNGSEQLPSAESLKTSSADKTSIISSGRPATSMLPLTDKRPTHSYNKKTFESNTDKDAHDTQVLAAMAAPSSRKGDFLPVFSSYDVDIDDSEVYIDSNFDDSFESRRSATTFHDFKGGFDGTLATADDQWGAPISLDASVNDSFAAVSDEWGGEPFGMAEDLRGFEAFPGTDPIVSTGIVADHDAFSPLENAWASDPFSHSGRRAKSVQLGFDSQAPFLHLPDTDNNPSEADADWVSYPGKFTSDVENASPQSGNSSPATPLSRHNLDITTLGGPPLKAPEPSRAGFSQSPASHAEAHPQLGEQSFSGASNGSTAFSAVRVVQIRNNSEKTNEATATSGMSAQFEPPASASDEKSHSTDNYDIDDDDSSSDGGESPAPSHRTSISSAAGSQTITSSDGQTRFISTQLHLKKKAPISSSSSIDSSYSGGNLNSPSNSYSRLEEENPPPPARRESVANQTTIKSATGSTLVSTQLTLKKAPPASSDDLDDESSGSGQSSLDSSRSDSSSHEESPYSSPEPKPRPRLNLKMMRIGAPPAPASEPEEVAPVAAPATSIAGSPSVARRNQLDQSDSEESPIESPTPSPPKKPRLKLSMTRIAAPVVQQNKEFSDSPSNARTSLNLNEMGGPRGASNPGDLYRSPLHRMISTGKGNHGLPGGYDEASMADHSVSDVFAQGVMAEAGKAFVPSGWKRALSDDFEDYEEARKALENFRNFKDQPGLKQATLTILATVLMKNNEKDRLDEVFRALDVDNDGRLSKKEIRQGFMEFCGRDKFTEGDIRKLFLRVGFEDTEYIGYTEFLIGAVNKSDMLSGESLQEAFKLLDTDGDGFISADELLQVLPSCDRTVEKIIAKVDFDGDGMISFGEFLSMVFKSAKVQANLKEKEWMKVVTPARRSSAPDPDEIKKSYREWKYKTAPQRDASYTLEEYSPVKMSKHVVNELLEAIPRTEALGFGDDDEGVYGKREEIEDEENSFSSGVDDNPVELPPELFSELKEAQGRLREFLRVVPDELKERPSVIADRPYIRELKDAQDTVLEKWRDQTYKYWI